MATIVQNGSVLLDALQRMFDDPLTCEKVKWWLQFGASTERWFQFEYGFWLNKCLGDEYAVGYEQRRVDLVVFRREPNIFPLSDNKALANLELKVQGNWYSKKGVFTKISWDQGKIIKLDQESPPHPAVALVIWFFAAPNKSADCYGWITKQVQNEIRRKGGLDTPQSIETRMQQEFGGAFKKIGSLKVPKCDDIFDDLEAQLFECRNEAAKRF